MALSASQNSGKNQNKGPGPQKPQHLKADVATVENGSLRK